MTWTHHALGKMLGRSSDLEPAELHARLAACHTCPQRVGGRCVAASQLLTVHALKRANTCPLRKWGEPPAESGEPDGGERRAKSQEPIPPSGSPPGTLRMALRPKLLETERIAREVTIGFTAFRRPYLVRRLYDSIRARYPRVRIVIAENGDRPAQLPADENLRMLNLPFDCGISASRNALIDALDTPYLWLLDDDEVLTDESDVGRLLDVLDARPEIGVAGGAIYDFRPGRPMRLLNWALDARERGGKLETTLAKNPEELTAAGTRFVVCDTVQNFALFRREMLADHRWRDALKVQEHFAYYVDVKRLGRWQVAAVDGVRCEHRRGITPEYQEFRGRPGARETALAECGLTGIDLVPFAEGLTRGEGRPNVLVFGIGHSGTTLATQMLFRLGWSAGDADAEYAESVEFREINTQAIRTGRFDTERARRFVAGLQTPWAIKDPRLTLTLAHWQPVLAGCRPALLWLTRRPEAVIGSYFRRGESLREGADYHQAFEAARRQFAAWSGPKFRLDFESLAAAAAMCDPARPMRTKLAGYDFDKTISGGANFRPTGPDWVIITARQEKMRAATLREIERLGLDITPDRVHLTPDGANGVEFKLDTIARLGVTAFYDDDRTVIDAGRQRLPACEFFWAAPHDQ
jgi:hypothetical protein